jgi:hypothetical protein
MKFLIVAYAYTSAGGGIIALHKLCHEMVRLGYDASLWFIGHGYTDPGYNTPVANPHGTPIVDPSECCVIYPEGVHNNPLGAKVAVTWILYMTGDALPFRVSYAPFFCKNYPGTEPLTVIETCEKYCKLPEVENREGACFLVRKGASTPRIPETENGRAFEIVTDRETDRIYKLFQSKSIFYNYDISSYHSVQAALCGCTSVVVPAPGVSKEDWRSGHPILSKGIAYGLDDLDYAKNTLPELLDHLHNIEKEGVNQIHRLVERVEKANKLQDIRRMLNKTTMLIDNIKV